MASPPGCLTALCLSREQTLEDLRAKVGVPGLQGQDGFTPRAWAAIETSVGVAIFLGHNYVGTEHLLLSLVNGVGGIADAILTERGATVDIRRPLVAEALIGYKPAPSTPHERNPLDRLRQSR